MEEKDYSVGINLKNVKNTNISRYSDGYNYASLGCAMGENEYMNISYEWKGKHIPEFAMSVMDIMKSLGSEKASVDPEVLERAGNFFIAQAAKVKKENPFFKKKMKDGEEEEDPKDKKSKDKKMDDKEDPKKKKDKSKDDKKKC